MRASVRAAFLPFTIPLEGVVKWLYPDVKGLVSIGIGNLVDPIGLALALPMVRPDGSPATSDEIAAEWHLVKTYPDAARLGHLSVEHVTQLRLTDEGLQQVVWGKLDQMEAYLQKRFAPTNDSVGYEDWPADAQLGTLSMAWACGPAFRFPKLEAALRQMDFRTAAVECFMPEEKTISGLRPRNKANRILFMNAASSIGTFDPDELFWPTDITNETPTVRDPASTPSPSSG